MLLSQIANNCSHILLFMITQADILAFRSSATRQIDSEDVNVRQKVFEILDSE
jgi:hypothetical protein